jgi:hypothetical protein
MKNKLGEVDGNGIDIHLTPILNNASGEDALANFSSNIFS